MENEPKANAGSSGKSQETDAAQMAARLLALRKDEGNVYAPVPAPVPAPSSGPKGSTAPARPSGPNRFVTWVLAVALFGTGAFIGARLEKHRKSKPVATVNGEEITPEDFAHICEIPVGRNALQQLINDKLLLQFAKKKNLTPDQVSLDAKFEKVKRSPNFFRQLKQSNQSEDDYKRALMITMANQAIVYNGVKASPQEAQDYYKANIDPNNPNTRFYHRESVTVGVIITKDEADIRKAAAELKAGAQFPTVVAKYSKDVSKQHAGLLDPIRKGMINNSQFAGLEKILFDLTPGQTTEPQRYNNFWWIIRCVGHSPESTDSFDAVVDECNTAVLLLKGVQKNGEALKKEEMEFARKSTIEITWPQYQDIQTKPN